MYYTTKEVAALLNYTDETIRRKIRKGEISAFKVRDKLQIPKDEVKKYLNSIVSGKDVTEENRIEIVKSLLNN